MEAEKSPAECARRVWVEMGVRHIVVGFVVSLALVAVFALAWLAVR